MVAGYQRLLVVQSRHWTDLQWHRIVVGVVSGFLQLFQILRAIDSGRVLQRPDLGMLYYPPLMDLYWFISRTVFILNSYSQTLDSPTLSRAKEMLTATMRNAATNQILSLSIRENNSSVYWQDFLGLADTNLFGSPHPNPDDRLFTTSGMIGKQKKKIWLWVDFVGRLGSHKTMKEFSTVENDSHVQLLWMPSWTLGLLLVPIILCSGSPTLPRKLLNWLNKDYCGYRKISYQESTRLWMHSFQALWKALISCHLPFQVNVEIN